MEARMKKLWSSTLDRDEQNIDKDADFVSLPRQSSNSMKMELTNDSSKSAATPSLQSNLPVRQSGMASIYRHNKYSSIQL